MLVGSATVNAERKLDGSTPLLQAAEKGFLGVVVKALLAGSATVNGERKRDGNHGNQSLMAKYDEYIMQKEKELVV